MNQHEPNPHSGLTLRQLTMRRRSGWELGPISLNLIPGETLAVVGPTGAGKSTLLRLVAGLEIPSAGEIELFGEPIHPKPPHERRLAFVMQEISLLPHLDVEANLNLPLRSARPPETQSKQRVHELAERWKVTPLLNRMPGSLSGGERQRVQLARSLACEPALVLMDEPWTFLDPPTRRSLQKDFFDRHRESGRINIVVTHDPRDAVKVANWIAVMNKGKIVQLAPPATIMDDPAHKLVEEFFAEVTSKDAEV